MLQLPTSKPLFNVTTIVLYVCRHAALIPVMIFMNYARMCTVPTSDAFFITRVRRHRWIILSLVYSNSCNTHNCTDYPSYMVARLEIQTGVGRAPYCMGGTTHV